MIKTSTHTVKFSNKNKKTQLASFLKEYRRVAAVFLDLLWGSPFEWETSSAKKTLDISKQLYDCPTFISTKDLAIETTLSARALKCCSTQVCGIIKAATEKPRKQQYMLAKLTAEGKPTKYLVKAMAKTKVVKPNISNIKAELNSICCDYQETPNFNASPNHFNGFLRLKSLGKTFGHIRIPIKYHRHSLKLQSKSTKLLNSFLVSNNSIDFRWEIPTKPKRTKGAAVGADQGKKDLLTLSNGVTTPKYDRHGHSLDSILAKLARKKKGSRAFGKAQVQRKNFSNWSVNQLDWAGIQILKLEKIININYKRRTSRLMSHWSNPEIRDKIIDKCEEEQVALVFQPSAYRSQRCSSCGWVQKANRNSKKFKCKSCQEVSDADLNAAKNIALDLPTISYAFRKQKHNSKGFFWNPTGITFAGGALTVPPSKKQATV